MEHYVTLFNCNFLPQGLALHTSMKRHVDSFLLWILCVDDETHKILSGLKLNNVSLLKLSTLETEELLGLKEDRTIGEYCWTLTPFAPKFVFDADPNVKRVTYIDADLWFRKDPGAIFQELEASGKAVLITDHGYAPEYDHSATSGQFCVQFLTFSRFRGECVRQWWQDRCVEWCYVRFEDGKFGDQKYLDDWPVRFSDEVHVLSNKELALAPWNALRFPYGNSIFFHFHSLRIVSDKSIYIGNYQLPDVLIKYVYQPYLSDLKASLKILRDVGYQYRPQAPKNKILGFPLRLLRMLRQFYRVLRLRVPRENIVWPD